MLISGWFQSSLAALLLAPSVLAGAQGLGVAEFIRGGKLPATIKFSAIDASYAALKIQVSGQGGGGEGMMGGGMGMGFMMMMGALGSMGGALGGEGGGGGGGGDMAGFLLLNSVTDTYWSKGETVAFGGHEFLVAYKFEFGMRKDIVPGADPSVPPMAARLRLTLVRTDMIASIAPDPDLDIAAITKMLDKAGIPYDVPIVELGQWQAMSTAILAPVFAQSKESAKKTATLSNAKQLALGMLMYSSDYDDVMPYAQSTAAVKYVEAPYLKNNELWKSLNPKGGEFRFNMALAGVSLTEVPEPANTPLFFEPNAWPDGTRVVAYTDGHAKRVDAEEWKRLQPFLKLKLKKTAKRPLPPNYGVGKG